VPYSIFKQLGLLWLVLSFLWFSFCFFLGTLGDHIFHEYVLSGLFGVWLVSIIREMWFFLGAITDKSKHTARLIRGSKGLTPKISVIVPAYNEEMTIADSFRSVLSLNYPDIEVIFVNDGSVDQTLSVVTEIASQYPEIPTLILSKPNGGKASALNFGLLHACGDLVLCVDSDSRLDPEGLRTAVMRFEDPHVGAVGGHVHLASTHNILLSFQQLEYLLALNFPRRALSLFGSVPVVPGPVGLFRRQALLQVGGYLESKSNFAEDAELSIRLLANRWRIYADEDLIAYTEAPEDIASLLRQRYRWVRGMYQAVFSHLGSMWQGGTLRGKGLASYLVFETAILPIFNFGLTILFLNYFFHSGVSAPLGVYLLYTAMIDICRVLIATHRDRGVLRWILLILVDKPFYSFFLQTWAVLCLFDEWRNEEMHWDKLERTGQLAGGGPT
jgi:cellulose synthase/poly-beta-1,6-N-acetylglucosamine synthase-like glycosyltransferase